MEERQAEPEHHDNRRLARQLWREGVASSITVAILGLAVVAIDVVQNAPIIEDLGATGVLTALLAGLVLGAFITVVGHQLGLRMGRRLADRNRQGPDDDDVRS